MAMVEQIAAKVRAAERISGQEALVLWREAPLWMLGELATAAKSSEGESRGVGLHHGADGADRA